MPRRVIISPLQDLASGSLPSAWIRNAHGAFSRQRRRPKPGSLVLEQWPGNLVLGNLGEGDQASVCCLTTPQHRHIFSRNVAIEAILI